MHLIRAFGIISILIAFLPGAAASQPAMQFDAIEIRLVAQKPQGGPMLPVEGSIQRVEVETETLLGPSDFVSVSDVEVVDGKPGFNVALTPAGAKKIEQVSAENVGRTLAIIIDGTILMAPKIRDPVRAQGFLVTVEKASEARRFASKVRQVITPN